MKFEENLKHVNALKNELDKLRPLDPDQEKRVMQKFRLDWNYHSSKIEGNTLTYGETKALILFGQTAQAKPLKDHLEISGHNEAILYIQDVIKKQRPLTETFIRDLHKIILKQPYQVSAITPDGKATQKWIKIGEYKTLPNHVLTKTGEVFYFATPEETPAEMADLMKWYKKEIEDDTLHPVIFATEFHYRFIRIHPFDDGNGRIARLLMNFILMQKGFPPAIIKTEAKENYFRALEQADAGQIEYFFNFIFEQVIFSLGLMLQAARGEEIGESEDLEKKLQLLKTRLGNDPGSKIIIKRNKDSVKTVIDKSLLPLVEAIEKKMMDFDSFFKSRIVTIEYGGSTYSDNNMEVTFKNIKGYIFKQLDLSKSIKPIKIEVIFKDLLSNKQSMSVRGPQIFIFFYENVYELKGLGLSSNINKLYNNYFSMNEIEQVVSQIGNWQYEVLEDTINKLGH